MELDKFTQKAQQALVQSQQLASDLNHQNIEPAHLLLALLQQDQGVVPCCRNQGRRQPHCTA